MKRLLCQVSALGLLTPAAALADITPEDVWANLGAAVTALGGEMSAELSFEGDVLKADGMRALFDLPGGAGRIALDLGDATFTDLGDGTVAIGGPAQQDIRLDAELDGEGGATVTMRFDLEDYVTTASGDPGNVTYSYDIGRYALRFTDLALRGKAAAEVRMDGTMDLRDLSGHYSIQEGALVRLRTDGVIGGMNLVYEYEIGAAGGETVAVRSTGTVGEMSATSDIRLPAGGVTLASLGRAFRDGLLVDYGYRVTDQHSEQSTRLDGGSLMRQEFDVGASEGSMIIGADGLRLDGSASDYALRIEQPDMLPAPIDVVIRRADALLAFPFLRTDTPKPASLKLDLAGVTLGDAVWAMFDPEAALPRDAARILVDLTAQLLWRADAVDFAAMERMGAAGEVPVELHALRVNDIVLSGLGTETTVTGAFTVDNDDTDTFAPGMPTPDGRAEIRLTGIMGLMQTLVDMGLVSAQEAMAPRMLLGGFAKQSGDDSYVSEIVVDGETGRITAGGQRLK